MQAPFSRRVLLAALGWRLSLAVGFGGLIGVLGGLWKSPLSYGALAAALLLRFVLDRRQWASKSFWDQAPLLLFFPLFALVATHSLNFELEQPLGLASACFGLGLIAAMIVWTKAPLPKAFPLSAAKISAQKAGEGPGVQGVVFEPGREAN